MTTLDWAIVISVLAVGAALFASFELRSRRAAAYFLYMQHEEASAGLVDELVQQAEAKGLKDLVLSKLTETRRLYGSDGVKVAHVMWLLRVLDGDDDRNEIPPDFRLETPKK